MNIFRKTGLALLLIFSSFTMLEAGNPDRAGQAGASELLINPWARSLGWNSINIAGVRGIESIRLNIGGLTLMEKTSVSFSHTQYLRGSGMSVSALGFGQKMGDGALGISVVSFGFGEIDITTTSQPEGGIGTFKPQYLNIGLAYSHSFADFIHGGVVLRMISESISDVSAQGVAIDAGLIYTNGPDAFPDKFKFGVSLRNVGTPMIYRGDGLTFRADVITGDYQQASAQLSQQFELPSQLNIGASYDFYFSSNHRLTAAANFSSNAFYKDQLGIGFEYGLKVKNKEMFLLRTGYKYENGLLSSETRTNAHTGLAGGFSLVVPFSKEEGSPKMSIDYAFRPSDPFEGSHSVGVTLDF